MKKTIIIIALLGIMFSSCSSDSSSGNLPLKFDNIIGSWYMKELIKPDGSHVNYVNQCGESRDYIEFYLPSEMRFFIYYGDTCTQIDMQEHCTGMALFTDTNTIQQCNSFINNGHVSKLTAHVMQIDFDDSRIFFYNNPQISIKGMVLER